MSEETIKEGQIYQHTQNKNNYIIIEKVKVGYITFTELFYDVEYDYEYYTDDDEDDIGDGDQYLKRIKSITYITDVKAYLIKNDKNDDYYQRFFKTRILVDEVIIREFEEVELTKTDDIIINKIQKKLNLDTFEWEVF